MMKCIYNDRSYCASPNCKNKCERKLDWEQIKYLETNNRELWWAYFCDKNGELIDV